MAATGRKHENSFIGWKFSHLMLNEPRKVIAKVLSSQTSRDEERFKWSIGVDRNETIKEETCQGKL